MIGSTETTLVNAALGLIGEDPLTSYADDNTDKARRVRAVYPNARNTVLAAKPWNGLIRRARLSADVTAPEWGWSYRYPLPNDLVFLTRDVYKGESLLGRGYWQKEGLYILSNETGPLDIRYVALITNPSEWGGLLEQVVIHYLAAKLARPMRGDQQLARELYAQFNRIAQSAASQNSRENNSAGIVLHDSWEAERWAPGSTLMGDTYPAWMGS